MENKFPEIYIKILTESEKARKLFQEGKNPVRKIQIIFNNDDLNYNKLIKTIHKFGWDTLYEKQEKFEKFWAELKNENFVSLSKTRSKSLIELANCLDEEILEIKGKDLYSQTLNHHFIGISRYSVPNTNLVRESNDYIGKHILKLGNKFLHLDINENILEYINIFKNPPHRDK